MILFSFKFQDVIMKSRPKKPFNPDPSPCTCPVKWPKIRPVIERDSISKNHCKVTGAPKKFFFFAKKLAKVWDKQ